MASNQIGCYLVSYTTASMQCQPCPEDTWCTHGVSTNCAPGSSAATGSDAQQDCLCDTGYYGPAGGLCQECAVDH
eukprot:3777147-Rhodomonas_salina.1